MSNPATSSSFSSDTDTKDKLGDSGVPLLKKPDVEAGAKKEEGDAPADSALVSFVGVSAYLVCSCFMLIVNKNAMVHLGGFAMHLVCLQILASCVLIYGATLVGILKENMREMLSLSAIRPWATFAFTWLMPILFNMKALQYMNADMVILFRAATTIAVATGDVIMFSRSFEISEISGILAIVVGCVIFALDNLNASKIGILWGLGYYFSLSFNTLYAKSVFNKYPKVSAWTKTFYCNFIAIVPCMSVATVAEDSQQFFSLLKKLNPVGITMVALSCVMGLLLGATGNICRHALSPTGFDIAGNVNKFVTIFLSQWIFDYVLTARANFGACVALVGASAYSKTISSALASLMAKMF